MPVRKRGGVAGPRRESVAERAARNAARRLRERQRRAERTALEEAARLAAEAARVAALRAAEMEQEAVIRRAADATRAEERRQQETAEEETARRAADAARAEERRQQETAEEEDARRAADAARAEERRQQETADEEAVRLAAVAQRQADLRRQPNTALPPGRSGVQPELYSVGPMGVVCSHCGALRFRLEKPSVCCCDGKISLPPFGEYPPELAELLTGDTSDARNFRDKIRCYNAAFAFISFGAAFARRDPGRGPYWFKIYGQVYHQLGTLHPPTGLRPSNAQLYIIDPSVAIDERMRHPANAGCRASTMELIHCVLDRLNPYLHAYRNMHEVEQEMIASGNPIPDISMHFLRAGDQRRYNEPRQSEVAVVFTTADGGPPAQRDMVVYPRGRPLQEVSFLSANCDPMVYPVLFPGGDLGWAQGTPHTRRTGNINARTMVTLREHYAYRLAVRQGTFSPLHRGGKLFHQYLVDSYVKVEANNLKFIREHQSTLRTELYSGLMDHLHSDAALHDRRVGRVTVLPSSFLGGPRAMHQAYLDAMAMVARYGKPDLFITFTCNPKCADIVSNLAGNEIASNRPDLVNRVFHLHAEEFRQDLVTRQVLGDVVSYVQVYETQKRGLFHVHTLLTLRDPHKLRSPEEVDTLICAELPDESDTELYETVKSSMMHGPCGVVCKVNGVCSKGFIKDFRDDTSFNGKGFPLYRRRNDGRTVTKGGVLLDNRSVVPYNAYLSRKYKAHINVEVCSSIMSTKYVHKYMYKGFDSACLVVRNTGGGDVADYDEVDRYIDTRYVSASEAHWRIMAFPMSDRSHTVIRLGVHLPNQQSVTFTEGSEAVAVEQARSQDSTLLAYFRLNSSDADARQYLYWQIPEHYLRNQLNWTRRVNRTKVIGRMYSVSPRDGERFCVRLLLLNVRGATSFESLRRVNGHDHDTFREACLALHIMDNDDVWHATMAEASVFQMPRQLRLMFTAICAYSSPSNPVALYNEFKASMCEDYARRHADDVAENMALLNLQTLFVTAGIQLSSFGLPAPDESQRVPDPPSTDDDNERQLSDNLQLMNIEQRQVFDAVVTAVDDHVEGRNSLNTMFLDGPAGTGKTFVYNTLIASLRSRSIPFAAAAWTGIAATLLHDGMTVHSLFKLPVPINENSTCNVRANSQHAAMLKSVALFIIDEVSMVPAYALKAIDILLRDITACGRPFGGKVVLLGGDFRQVLPIVPKGSRSAVVESCLKRSELWSLFRQFQLSRNMRANDDVEFSNWLLDVGSDSFSVGAEDPPGCVCIPQALIVPDVVRAIFSESVLASESQTIGSAILAPKNDLTHTINERILDKLPGEAFPYLSSDSIETEDEGIRRDITIEFLNSITPSGMPLHELRLKVGAVVILLRNMCIRLGLCNGTRLIVRRLHSNCVEAEITAGNFAGTRALIPRFRLISSEYGWSFELRREQFPLRLAYAMTINKAQGQTFERVGLFLNDPVFAHGQMYVALSRARNSQSVKVELGPRAVKGLRRDGVYTPNVVYRNVL